MAANDADADAGLEDRGSRRRTLAVQLVLPVDPIVAGEDFTVEVSLFARGMVPDLDEGLMVTVYDLTEDGAVATPVAFAGNPTSVVCNVPLDGEHALVAVVSAWDPDDYRAKLWNPLVDAAYSVVEAPISLEVTATVEAGGGLTLALQHFEGTNGQPAGPDEVLGVNGWFINNGSLSNLQAKFGTLSGRPINNPAYCGVLQSNVLVDITQPWTVEIQCWPGSSGKNAPPNQLKATAAGLDAFAVTFTAGPINTWSATVRDAVDGVLFSDSGALVLNGNAWSHIAFVFSGTDYSFYIEGVRLFTFASTTPIKPPVIWQLVASPGISDQFGDEARVSQTARYSGVSFTPPAAPFVVD